MGLRVFFHRDYPSEPRWRINISAPPRQFIHMLMILKKIRFGFGFLNTEQRAAIHNIQCAGLIAVKKDIQENNPVAEWSAKPAALSSTASNVVAHNSHIATQ